MRCGTQPEDYERLCPTREKEKDNEKGHNEDRRNLEDREGHGYHTSRRHEHGAKWEKQI